MFRMFCLALLGVLGVGLMTTDGRAACDNYCRVTANFYDCKNSKCFGTTYAVCHYCTGNNLCSDTLGGGWWWCRKSTYENHWYWADSCAPSCSCAGVLNVSATDLSGLDLLDPHADVRSACSFL